MSLHAQLSPEAQARLASQKRASTLTSLFIAILSIVLIGVILLIIGLTSAVKHIPQATYQVAESQPEPDPTFKKITNTVKKKPTSPSRNLSRVVVANVPSAISVPVPEIILPSDDGFGDGDGFGSGGFGGGEGAPGGDFRNIPVAIRKRCSQADRMQRLLESGGTAECEDSVVKALRWLKDTQNKDGSWINQKQVGMTGLALLAFLGHCETAGSEEFGESVLAATTYLIDIAMKNNGKLASDFKDNHWCYEHAIATYALAEAYTLCVKGFGENIFQLEESVMAAGQFLINSQHQGGGWDYAYSEDSARGGDVSIVGWHLQALKACKLTGLDFKNLRSCSKRALDYLERMQMPSGAIGYASPSLHANQDGTTLAAVGALSAQIWKGPATAVARKAVRFIDKEMKFDWNTADSDLYGHYYAAQAMINHGGEEWEKYNILFRDQVLHNQDQNGSFRPVGGGAKINAVGASFSGDAGHGRHYRTCLATLMLETYYRFLPASRK